MDAKSGARGSHYLLLLSTRELPKYRLCYGEGGLYRQRIHEHARRCRHFIEVSQPAGFYSDD